MAKGVPPSAADAGKEIFNNNWATYRKVVEGDHLEHKRLLGALAHYVQEKTGGQAADILDLGCGDASCIASLLKGPGAAAEVASYTGVDLSGAALSLARENLEGATPPGKLRLVQDSLQGYMAQSNEILDIIFAFFSLHHLDLEAKAAVVQQARRLLKPATGALLVIDVFLREGETRAAYLERYIPHVEAAWLALNSDERLVVKNHVCECDFPAQLSDYKRFANDSGFADVQCICTDSQGFGKLVAFTV